MSNRSNRHSQARAPLAPRPVVGRLNRRLQRRLARQAAGDFSTLRPVLDVKLRRLMRAALAHLQTRHGQ